MKLRFDPAELTRQIVLSRETCTPELGAMLLDAVRTMAKGRQWRGYAFRSDLEGDALLALQTAPRSFKPERCRDPNGWLALCITRSFGKTVKREKQLYATCLRLALGSSAEIAPMQLDWLRQHEARKTQSTRVDA